MSDFLIMFLFLLVASLIPLVLAILGVFFGLFQGDESRRQCFMFAAKSFLVFAVMLMVGFGGCVLTFSMSSFN